MARLNSLIAFNEGRRGFGLAALRAFEGVGHGSFQGVAGFGGVAECAIAVFKPDFGL